MSELKPCPCGKTPTRLWITDAGQKIVAVQKEMARPKLKIIDKEK